MPKRLSTILGVSREILESLGVFDSTVDYDSRLHLDPALLGKSNIPEFENSRRKVVRYFRNILLLASKLKREGDPFWNAAHKLLCFGEGLNSGLGYSSTGTSGSGIGAETATRILHTVKQIVDAGITDPEIFHLVPIFESRIGPDRISDMISLILQDEFIAYTKRIVHELKVDIPIVNSKPIVFVPKELLSNLPIAEQWEDIGIAAAYNESVRNSISSLIGKSWRQIASEYTKQGLKALFISNPELLKELLAMYKERKGNSYDFILDHLGILLWDIVGPQVAEEFPIDLKKYQKVTSENILEVVMKICVQYKNLIENNGLVEPLYDDEGKRRPERFAQLLFFAIADSYCNANDLDLNREINAGSGALDFKMSHGLAKVTVEIKYSNNPKLVEGFEKQLPIYNKAEKVPDQYSIYLVLRINDNQDQKLRKIDSIIADRTRIKQSSPGFFVVDAIIKPTASKR